MSEPEIKTYIVTGGTRGLGLSIAEEIDKLPNTQIILAVRDTELGAALAPQVGKNVSVKAIDMSSCTSVEKFLNDWKKPLAGLINNAGIQNVDMTRLTDEEGYEETFAVNHLYAIKLTIGLLGHLRGGRVLFIGSGTHNPRNRAKGMSFPTQCSWSLEEQIRNTTRERIETHCEATTKRTDN